MLTWEKVYQISHPALEQVCRDRTWVFVEIVFGWHDEKRSWLKELNVQWSSVGTSSPDSEDQLHKSLSYFSTPTISKSFTLIQSNIMKWYCCPGKTLREAKSHMVGLLTQPVESTKWWITKACQEPCAWTWKWIVQSQWWSRYSHPQLTA